MEGFGRISSCDKDRAHANESEDYDYNNPTRYARKAPEFFKVAKIGRDDTANHCIVFYRVPKLHR